MKNGKRATVLAVVWTICLLLGAAPGFAGVDVPEKLKDIPLFEGSKVVQAMDMGPTAMIGVSVKARPEAVGNFYKNFLKGKGWKIVVQTEQEDVHVINFQKDNRMINVSIQLEKGSEVTNYNIMTSSN